HTYHTLATFIPIPCFLSSQFSNYSGIDAVAHSGHHTTSLALHSLHTYHTLATFIPIPCSLAPKLGYLRLRCRSRYASHAKLPRLCDAPLEPLRDRIPDSRFPNYSDIDAVANSGHQST
ncbi:hypothetical protein, partial [Moorena sp. SIO3H5]|uniref:hypothetical protein n=1 Tax=Moorena sp. SIO3H5 TaxID=2607834 RepID=UPI0013BC2E83